MADNDKRKEKKKKKERVNINLPKARASIRRSREMGQMKRNYEDAWKAVGIILGFILFLFVIMGGINQRMFWEEMAVFGKNVGERVSKWINLDGTYTNENGIYWDPSSNHNPENQTNETTESNNK